MILSDHLIEHRRPDLVKKQQQQRNKLSGPVLGNKTVGNVTMKVISVVTGALGTTPLMLMKRL